MLIVRGNYKIASGVKMRHNKYFNSITFLSKIDKNAQNVLPDYLYIGRYVKGRKPNKEGSLEGTRK